MIKLRMTPELLTDIFSPGTFGPIECVTGLPDNIKLINVSLDDKNILEYQFDDGNEEIIIQHIEFRSPKENK